MPKTKAPKFAELFGEYQDAQKLYERKNATLQAAQKDNDEAAVGLNQKSDALMGAMRTYGIQSIRENSWDTEYFYLDADCTLVKRAISTVEEADERVTVGVV